MKAHVTVHSTVLIAGAAALLAIGAAAAYVGAPARAVDRSTAVAPPRPAITSAESSQETVVTLDEAAIERAGIVVAEVTEGPAVTGLRAPGIVAQDAYRQVTVTPLVGGRVTSVMAELGQQVRRGQTIARILSPELAEARTRYVSVSADLAAHERELARVEKLVQIGAASRQELERVHAAHTARRAEVESAAARLNVLGVPEASMNDARAADAIVDVPAPITGVVTARTANVGMNVDATTTIFTVVDLSTVWVMVDVYERDFARVRVGSTATIATPAYPGLTLHGRIDYIDPQLAVETRTAKARIAVPNARGELRLGMFVEATIDAGRETAVPLIPRSAVQTVGSRTVVYLADPKRPGTFVQREVRLGSPVGDRVPVLGGVHAGDRIVSEGSFFVRASGHR